MILVMLVAVIGGVLIFYQSLVDKAPRADRELEALVDRFMETLPDTTMSDHGDEIQGIMDREIKVRQGAARQGDIRKNYSIISKARDVLQWQPVVPLEAGLKKTWEWYADALALAEHKVSAKGE